MAGSLWGRLWPRATPPVSRQFRPQTRAVHLRRIQDPAGRQALEVINGQAYDVSPAPRRIHQTITVKLIVQLDTFFAGKPRRPNLLVACDPRQLIDEGIKGAPASIIEILSLCTAFKNRTEKRYLHERFGVPGCQATASPAPPACE